VPGPVVPHLRPFCLPLFTNVSEGVFSEVRTQACLVKQPSLDEEGTPKPTTQGEEANRLSLLSVAASKA
jgi:hypothetical protein